MNDNVNEGTILLWDEPESNINPNFTEEIAKIILELSRNGVQVFIATHDYYLPKYIELFANSGDELLFHSLYKTENGVECETDSKFNALNHNKILEEKIRLYEMEVEKVLS